MVRGLLILLALVALPLLFAEGQGKSSFSQATYQRALTAYQQRDFELAQRLFGELVAHNPKVMSLHLDYGVVLEGAGKVEEAREAYNKAAGVFPRAVEPLRSLCKLNYRIYQEAKAPLAQLAAEVACREAVSKAGHDEGDQMLLGTLYSLEERTAEALECFDRAHAIIRKKKGADNPDLLRVHSQALFRAGNCTGAVQLARRLYSLSQDLFPLCNLAHLLASCEPNSAEGVAANVRCMSCSEETGECRVAVPDRTLCPNYNFKFCGPEWDRCVSPNLLSVRVVNAGDEELVYGRAEGPLTLDAAPLATPMPLLYNEKRIYTVALRNVYMISKNALVYSDCHLYLGGHSFNAKVLEAFSPTVTTITIDQPVLNMISQTHNNYYHFMAENLPRLLLGLKHVPGAERLKVLIPGDNRFILETARLFKLEDRVIIYLAEENRRYLFRELHFADWSQLRKDEVHQYNSWALFQPPRAGFLAVREAFFPLITAPRPARPTILFTSRSDLLSSRHVNGEEALLARLASAFPDHDVVSFSGSKHTLLEQATAYRYASMVVGPHGAGLSNIMFCDPLTPIVYLPMEPNVDSNFGHMAMAVNLTFWIVPSVTSSFHGQYNIDDDAIEQIVAVAVEAMRVRRLQAAGEGQTEAGAQGNAEQQQEEEGGEATPQEEQEHHGGEEAEEETGRDEL